MNCFNDTLKRLVLLLTLLSLISCSAASARGGFGGGGFGGGAGFGRGGGYGGGAGYSGGAGYGGGAGYSGGAGYGGSAGYSGSAGYGGGFSNGGAGHAYHGRYPPYYGYGGYGYGYSYGYGYPYGTTAAGFYAEDAAEQQYDATHYWDGTPRRQPARITNAPPEAAQQPPAVSDADLRKYADQTYSWGFDSTKSNTVATGPKTEKSK